MAHVEAAGGQHLFDHAQAQGKAEVEPDRVADDLAWKAVAGIGGLGCGCHAGHLPVPPFPAKPRPKLTVPSPPSATLRPPGRTSSWRALRCITSPSTCSRGSRAITSESKGLCRGLAASRPFTQRDGPFRA